MYDPSARQTSALLAAALAAAALLPGCGQPQAEPPPDLGDWAAVEKASRGSVARLGMWTGDAQISAYVREFLAKRLKRAYGIDLEVVSAQGGEIVSRLLVDQEAGRERGDFDLVWINGETFYKLRQIDALYGPFARDFPNSRYIDWEDPFIAKDFQQPADGYEVPWGTVQFALIHDAARTPNPPRSAREFADWIRENPGRFTLSNDFTGMTFLKSLLYHFAEDPKALDGPFDEAAYVQASNALWRYLRPLRPSIWRRGETYPSSVAQLHRLFANGEVAFTMSNNDGEVDNKVLHGAFPDTARAYVPDFGSIRNSHYLGIPANAPNKAAALVVANFAISPRAQLEKAKPEVWGDGPALDLEALPPHWQERFRAIPGRQRAPDRAALAKRALPEPAPEVMVRLMEDFRRRMIENRP